jgi:hypothetical protein
LSPSQPTPAFGRDLALADSVPELGDAHNTGRKDLTRSNEMPLACKAAIRFSRPCEATGPRESSVTTETSGSSAERKFAVTIVIDNDRSMSTRAELSDSATGELVLSLPANIPVVAPADANDWQDDSPNGATVLADDWMLMV